jgi:NADH-quinone oxidoreductase subunit F
LIHLERKDWKDCEVSEIQDYLKSLTVQQDEAFCSVNQAKQFTEYARRSTCGRCVICREGILQSALIIKDITEGKGKDGDLAILSELAENLKAGSICDYGKTVGEMLQSMLDAGHDDFEKHLKRKRCDALVCKEYISYHILGDKCTGCGECKLACPNGAIEGDAGLIHVISLSNCNKCGDCMKVCTSSAITKAGAIKPKTPEKPIPVGTFKPVGLGGGLLSGRRRSQ